MVLKEPYGLVLESLGKSGAQRAFMMPKRVADTDPNTQITDATGSGPFIFKKDEWKAGEKAVYVKNPKYKPRTEPPSGLAGGKVAKVDRVEWIWIPDTADPGERAAQRRGRPDRDRAPRPAAAARQGEERQDQGGQQGGPAVRHALQRAAQAVRQRQGPPGRALCA